jgi:hypothetical protein
MTYPELYHDNYLMQTDVRKATPMSFKERGSRHCSTRPGPPRRAG